MASEIEAKFRIESIAPQRERLADLGAQPLGAVLETNHYYDWPDRRLRDGDSGLRVRVAQPLDVPDARPKVVVTYKGPRRPGVIKVRQEIQFTADDAPAAREFLEALGLVNTITFQKRRESWSLDGCLVELDELPDGGTFLEIEGPDESAVRAAQQRMGLSDQAMEQANYLGMMIRYRDAHRPGQAEITFADTR